LKINQKVLPWIIWASADSYFILSVTIAILFGAIAPNLQKELNLTNEQLGFLSFAFFFSYGSIQFFAGNRIDSQGPRVTLVASALIAAGGLFLLSHAQSFEMAVIAQFAIGIGLAASYVGAIYLATIWFSEKRFPVMSGLTQMSANILSGLVLFIIVWAGMEKYDFRVIFSKLAYISLALAFLLLLFVRGKSDKKGTQKPKTLWKDSCQLARIPQFWYAACFFTANMSVFLAFSSLWNISDSLAYGHSIETATMMSATLRLGGAAGAILSGLMVRFIWNIASVTKVYGLGAFILGAFLVFGPSFPDYITFIVMACLGFFLGGTVLGFPLVGQYIPFSLKGTGFGLMTSMAYLLSACLQFLIGLLLEQKMIHSLSLIEAYKIALTPLIAFLVVGWLCTLKLKKTA
jgi:MFS family permease